MDVGPAFPSHGQAPVLVEQDDGLLYDPAAGGDLVAGSAARDVAGDPAFGQLGVHTGVVVALVADERLDAVAWWPRPSTQGGEPGRARARASCGRRGEQRRARRRAGTRFHRSTGGVWSRSWRGLPGWVRSRRPLCCPHVRAVDHDRSKSINPAALLRSRTAWCIAVNTQRLASLVACASTSSLTRIRVPGRVFPFDPCEQHEQDALEHQPWIVPGRAWCSCRFHRQ